MKSTHKFKLLTGPWCEVSELSGLQQHILSENNTKDSEEKFALMIQSILISVGSVTNISLEFISKLLSADRKKILEEARRFSMRDTEHENKFIFHYPFTDKNGIKQQHELQVDLTIGFPTKPYLFIDTDGEKKVIDVEEYEQLDKYREVRTILPREKKEVAFYLLDGVRERVAATIKEENRSSNTPLIARNPRYIENGTPIQIDLNKLPLIDIEHIRKLIRELEGEVDTSIEFEHPEAKRLPRNKQIVKADLIGQTAFFYPSEAI